MKSIKVLAVAAFAALALTALPSAASAAQPGFTSTEYPALVSGPGAYDETYLELGGGELYCDSQEVDAYMFAASSALSSTAEDPACSGFGEIETNGCQYVFHPGAEEKSGSVQGTLEIGGPDCSGMDWQWSWCWGTIPAQGGISAEYTNTKSGVRVEAETSALKFTSANGCGGKGSYENGDFEATWNLTGAPSLSVSTKAISEVGVFVNDWDWAEEPKFDAERFPINLVGEQTGSENYFLTSLGEVECGEVSLSGLAAGVSTTMDLDATYQDCLFGGALPTTVDMNGCHYRFELYGDSSPSEPYDGSKSIVCQGSPEYIDIAVSGGGGVCHMALAPQEMDGVAFSYHPSGADQIDAASSIEGIEYDLWPKSACGKQGTFTDGSEVSEVTISGLG